MLSVICHHSHSGNKTCARNEPNCFGKFKIELFIRLVPSPPSRSHVFYSMSLHVDDHVPLAAKAREGLVTL